jgi:poly(3-hydroxybutyrate) depolymerase
MTIENEIFVPEDLSAARPLLIALHGGGRDAQSQLDLWRTLAAREQIIVLAPNAQEPPYIQRLGSLQPTGSFWSTK